VVFQSVQEEGLNVLRHPMVSGDGRCWVLFNTNRPTCLIAHVWEQRRHCVVMPWLF